MAYLTLGDEEARAQAAAERLIFPATARNRSSLNRGAVLGR